MREALPVLVVKVRGVRSVPLRQILWVRHLQSQPDATPLVALQQLCEQAVLDRLVLARSGHQVQVQVKAWSLWKRRTWMQETVVVC